MVVSDGTFQRSSIKHSGFNLDSVIEASFKVLNAVPDIMNKVQLSQDRILTDAEQLALATGAAAYRWEDLTKAPVSPSMLLYPRRYGDGAKDLFITLNCVHSPRAPPPPRLARLNEFNTRNRVLISTGPYRQHSAITPTRKETQQ
jgi:hypothetical protein